MSSQKASPPQANPKSAASAKTVIPPPPADEAKPAKSKPAPEEPRGTIAEWTVTVLLLLFGTTVLIQAFVIPTSSMEETLLVGDHLLVDKLAYSPGGPVSKYLLPYTEVKRGDIIVFRYPVDPTQNFVKRVIGVPGDRIKIVNREVYRNDAKIEEPYKIHKGPVRDPYGENFPSQPFPTLNDRAREMLEAHVTNGELVVPPEAYFAMGDNRDNSLDSRYWGFVPRKNIVGKPLIIYWSYDYGDDRESAASFTPRHLRRLIFEGRFFTDTRWKRTFHLIRGYESKN